jgi:hypothetical protein
MLGLGLELKECRRINCWGPTQFVTAMEVLIRHTRTARCIGAQSGNGQETYPKKLKFALFLLILQFYKVAFVPKHHCIGKIEAKFHALQTSTLYGSGWLPLHSAVLSLEEDPVDQFNQKLVRKRKIYTPARNRTLVVQPVARHFTD